MDEIEIFGQGDSMRISGRTIDISDQYPVEVGGYTVLIPTIDEVDT